MKIIERHELMAEDKKTDVNQIKKIVSMMVDNDLVEVEIVTGEDKIYLRRPEAQPQQITAVPMAPQMVAAPHAAPAPAPAAETEAPTVDDGLLEITSPIVGTFYSASSPDSEPYTKIGDIVAPETVVCIIEAMKVMNEIKSEISGKVVEIVAQNGQSIEYGQVLYKVKP
jgi:acetyl-CoA carboxylase biotin carboxyl carrier protein